MKECIIKANCPVCLAGCEDIVYQNSGPIVRIYCSKCGVVYNDYDAKKMGLKTSFPIGII